MTVNTMSNLSIYEVTRQAASEVLVNKWLVFRSNRGMKWGRYSYKRKEVEENGNGKC
jgi:hypothetical protein